MAREPRKKVAVRARAAAPPPRRPSAAALWFRRQRRILRGVGLGVLGLGALAGVVWGVARMDPEARARDAALALVNIGRDHGLVVQEIRVEGREFTPREALLTAIGTVPGDAILDFDPDAARARLLEIAWVRGAHVERRLPGTILVRLEERQAFAIWQQDGRYSVIDRTGNEMASERFEAFGPLPFVVGAGANTAAASIVDVLRQHPAIADRVEAAVRVSERRWNLRLHNGADVLLPEGHEQAAVERLAALHAQDRLLDRPLAVVDMRLPDRLVVRMPPEAPATPPATPAQARRQRG